MNQQRSRRFRASKETSEKVIEIARVRAKLEAEGAILPPPKEGSHFDSNCITPVRKALYNLFVQFKKLVIIELLFQGTPFMDRLSKCLHYYAHDRLNNNPAWKDLKIILSDANVPGEGEHKVMDFIRKQRGKHIIFYARSVVSSSKLYVLQANRTMIRIPFIVYAALTLIL